jgi:hypothetical protein
MEALSRRKPGFKPPWDYQIYQLVICRIALPHLHVDTKPDTKHVKFTIFHNIQPIKLFDIITIKYLSFGSFLRTQTKKTSHLAPYSKYGSSGS